MNLKPKDVQNAKCICHQLHKNCDPVYCPEAALDESDPDQSGVALEEPVRLTLKRDEIKKAIHRGCPTCKLLEEAMDASQFWGSMGIQRNTKSLSIKGYLPYQGFVFLGTHSGRSQYINSAS